MKTLKYINPIEYEFNKDESKDERLKHLLQNLAQNIAAQGEAINEVVAYLKEQEQVN